MMWLIQVKNGLYAGKMIFIKNISTLPLRVLIFTNRTQKKHINTTIMGYIKDAEREELSRTIVQEALLQDFYIGTANRKDA